MTRRQTLRRLVGQKQGLVVPGAYDGVSAKLVEQAGFPVVYMTGYGVSASRLGLPDMGFAGLG
ncbi:MAG TPA: isocitrate lyase/phosphoenolpyruvate mutase family protein, partial [Methylomirabilota bacterium]|nr:isocitrate lyase/phosphoenolpyruvate mutase family protein [Methylomirabilota bacterium]